MPSNREHVDAAGPYGARPAASASLLSRPAQASLALRPVGSLNRLKRPLSRGFNPASYPAKPLVSYQSNRQFSGWDPPPLVTPALGAHCKNKEFCTWKSSLITNGFSGAKYRSGIESVISVGLSASDCMVSQSAKRKSDHGDLAAFAVRRPGNGASENPSLVAS